MVFNKLINLFATKKSRQTDLFGVIWFEFCLSFEFFVYTKYLNIASSYPSSA